MKRVKKENKEEVQTCPVLCRWHSSMVNLCLHLVSLVILIWALWVHNPVGILVAIIIAALGHCIQIMKEKRR